MSPLTNYTWILLWTQTFLISMASQQTKSAPSTTQRATCVSSQLFPAVFLAAVTPIVNWFGFCIPWQYVFDGAKGGEFSDSIIYTYELKRIEFC